MRRMIDKLWLRYTGIREALSPARTDRVQVDTLRAQQASQTADRVIALIEQDSVLRRRLRLIEHRQKDTSPLFVERRQEHPQ